MMDTVKLRQKAEQLIDPQNKGIGKTPDEAFFAREEIEVYQIELSMQNEELQRAGLEIELSRDKYLKLYDFAPVGFFTFETNGLIREVNRTGSALFGMEKEFLTGKVFTAFVAAEYQEIFFLFCQRLQEVKTKQECELKLRKNDGTTFYALVEGIAQYGEKGEKTFLLVAVSDISERKKNEEEKLKYQRLKP